MSVLDQLQFADEDGLSHHHPPYTLTQCRKGRRERNHLCSRSTNFDDIGSTGTERGVPSDTKAHEPFSQALRWGFCLDFHKD